MLTLLRFWGFLQGAGLMAGELIRSAGQDRPLVFVVDDFFIGIPLVLTAWLMSKPTTARRAAFSAAFAASAGMLYGSFFGKLINPGGDFSTSIEPGFLTFLIGLAFFSAVISLLLSLWLWARDEAR